MSSLCIDNKLLLINNLRTHATQYCGKKTFRKGGRWVSELDVCASSYQLIPDIKRFEVHQVSCLPSDHAPVAIEVGWAGVDLDD